MRHRIAIGPNRQASLQAQNYNAGSRCRSMATSCEFTGENAVQCISMRICNTLPFGRSGPRGVQTRLFCMCVVWLAERNRVSLRLGERVLGRDLLLDSPPGETSDWVLASTLTIGDFPRGTRT